MAYFHFFACDLRRPATLLAASGKPGISPVAWEASQNHRGGGGRARFGL